MAGRAEEGRVANPSLSFPGGNILWEVTPHGETRGCRVNGWDPYFLREVKIT